MRSLAAIVLLLAVVGARAEEYCLGAVVDIFGGRLTLPCAYRLQPESGGAIRFLRIEKDPRQPYGNIYIGAASTLPSQQEREATAREMGATWERVAMGRLSVEITTRTTQQLLVDDSVTYVSALIYDAEHYVRVTDSDPKLWRQLVQRCEHCR